MREVLRHKSVELVVMCDIDKARWLLPEPALLMCLLGSHVPVHAWSDLPDTSAA